MARSNVIRCRFCQWQRHRWTRKKGGKATNNYPSLVTHVFYEHREEFDKLAEKLDLEFGEATSGDLVSSVSDR